MDSYVTIKACPQTRRYRGVRVDANYSSSGSPRPIVSVQTQESFSSPQDALEAISRQFPDLEAHQGDFVMILDEHMPQPGDEVRVVRSRNGTVMEAKLWRNRRIAGDLSEHELRSLLALNLINLGASSGNDPELSYVYETYEACPMPEARKTLSMA